MTERRKILAALPTAIVGLSALGAATIATDEEKSQTPEAIDPRLRDALWAKICASGSIPIDPRQRDAFPDVSVISHTGERFRFYDDLIKDKIVLVNFMSIRSETHYPVTANLAKVAQQLGDRLGRDVYINSVTRDPRYDTPARLKAFAEAHGAPHGWRFLTAELPVTHTLETRLYRHHPHSEQHRSVDIVFYGNGGVGLWGAFPGLLDPKDAATRVTWVMNGRKPEGPLRRAGPRRLRANDRSSHNRDS